MTTAMMVIDSTVYSRKELLELWRYFMRTSSFEEDFKQLSAADQSVLLFARVLLAPSYQFRWDA